MTFKYNLKNTIRNELLVLKNPLKLVSLVILLLLDLKLLHFCTPYGGHLRFVYHGRHSKSPAWLPQEIDNLWSCLALVQKWCLWNDLNNNMIKLPDYVFWGMRKGPMRSRVWGIFLVHLEQ